MDGQNELKKSEIVILILTITIIGIFSIHEIHVQAIAPPCIAPEDPDITRQDYLKFSNAIISDWELIDIEITCAGTIVANYEIPEFSSEESSYEVSVIIINQDFRRYTQFLEDLLKNKNLIISNGISKLHSSDLFKEINEKLMIQTVSFDYHPMTDTIRSQMKFLVTAKNQYGYSSSFSTDPFRDRLGWLALTNDVDIESVGVHEARKQVEIFLTNTNSTCQIMSCTESSCGATKVAEKYDGYTVNIQLKGELCPPFIRVDLDNNLKFQRILPVDKYYQKIEWPLLIESKFDPPLKQVKNNINPENVICNKDLQLILKSTDSSPASLKYKTAQKLIERGWASS